MSVIFLKLKKLRVNSIAIVSFLLAIVSLLAQVKSQIEAMQSDKAAFEIKMAELEQAIESRVNEAVESRVSEMTTTKLAALEAEKDEFYRAQIGDIETKNKEFVELIRSDFNARVDQISEVMTLHISR